MENYNIYEQISKRTQGDIYVGVVGPVRTGKSTFIRRFMDLFVIPNIDNEFVRERTTDELPQSGTGRTIMTTEPKFIPNEAINITVDENVNLKIRMVDCVGYLVKSALGYMEYDTVRMVSTPWFEEQVPFSEAAEIGTKKVINDHSTLGLVVTTDGTVTEINREDYIPAEERVINELKDINKPFIIILNSSNPNHPDTLALKEQMELTYDRPVLPVNCAQMSIDDVNMILERVLFEFPVYEIGFNIPGWVESLDNDHWLKKNVIEGIKSSFKEVSNIRHIKDAVGRLQNCEHIKKAYIDNINLGEGSILIETNIPHELFYRVLSELTGLEVEGDHQLIDIMKDFSRIKKEYEKIEFALHEVKLKGYGIVTPHLEELTLEQPEIVKHGSRFGVKLRASAPSIHIVCNKQKCTM